MAAFIAPANARFDWMLKVYRGSLGVVLRHQALTLLVTIGTAVLSIYAVQSSRRKDFFRSRIRDGWADGDPGGAGYFFPRHAATRCSSMCRLC